MELTQIYKLVRLFFGFDLIISVFDEQRDNPVLWQVKKYSCILSYLKKQNELSRHIFLRPSPKKESFFMLADDLCFQQIQRDHMNGFNEYKKGRLIVETSKDNYQVWVKVNRPLTIEEKVYWLNKQGSDKSCHPKSRNGRFPGFKNVKQKYSGNYPLAKLVYINSEGIDIPQIDIPKQKKQVMYQHSYMNEPINIGHSTIFRSNYESGYSNSETDFRFCLALLRRQKWLKENERSLIGYSDSDIKSAIFHQRKDWTNHQGEKRTSAYINKTFDKCRQIIYELN